MELFFTFLLLIAGLIIGYLISTLLNKKELSLKSEEIAILKTRLDERGISEEQLNKSLVNIESKHNQLEKDKELWSKEKETFLKERLVKSKTDKIKNEYALNMRGKDNEKELKKLIATTIYVENKTVFYDKKLEDKSGRPDVRFQPTPEMKILADAKAPLDPFDEYFEALEQGDNNKIKSIQTTIAESIKKHIDELSKKAYQKSKGSFPYVLMFLPSEMHEQIVREASSLIQKNLDEYAFEKNILITGPRNFLSDLSWAERLLHLEKNNEVVKDTIITIGELFKNVRIMLGHLNKQTKTMNEASASTHLLNSNFVKYLNVLVKIKNDGFKNEDLEKSINELDEISKVELNQVNEIEDKGKKINEIENVVLINKKDV